MTRAMLPKSPHPETKRSARQARLLGCTPACTVTHPALNLSALQAIKLLHMTKVFGKSMRVNKASQDKDSADVGANLFIGNLDPDLDEKVSGDSVCHHTAGRCVRQM